MRLRAVGNRYCQAGSAAHGAPITCNARAPHHNDNGAVRDDSSLEFRLVSVSAYQQQQPQQ